MAWLPMVAATIKYGNDRVRKGNSFPSHGLYGVFSVPVGQFTLVAYPGERAGNASHLCLDNVTRNALAARNNED